LPPSWIQRPLEDVAEIRDDLRRPVNSTERAERMGDYPYYGATGQVGWIDNYLMDGEYVLLGEDGAPFLDPARSKAYIVKGKCWVNNHAHVLQARDGTCTNSFLLYALNSTDYRGLVNGTTRLKLTQGAMRRILISLPPIAEQYRIVGRLDELFSRLDAAVAALKRVQANLKRYRASVLKAAVEGRLTEAWRAAHPAAETGAELLRRILAERRTAWERAELERYATAGKTPPLLWRDKYREPSAPDTTGLPELPELPEGWCRVGLAQAATFQNGRSFPSEQYTTEGVKLLRPGNLHVSGAVRWSSSNTKLLPESWAGQFPDYIVQSNEMIMNLTAQSLKDDFLGRVCLTGTDERCLLNQRLARITPVPNVHSRFLFYVLQSPPFRRFVDTLNTGSLIQHMFTSQLDGFSFDLPPWDEQKEIVDAIESSLSIAETAATTVELALQRAERLRQSILKRAFEGKLVPQDPTDEPVNQLLEQGVAALASLSGTSGHQAANGANAAAPRKRRGARGAAPEQLSFDLIQSTD
jgi:type I restriction enzyme S subunit